MLTIRFEYKCDVTGQSYAQTIEARQPTDNVPVPKPPPGWVVGADGTVVSPTVGYSTGGTFPSISSEGKVVTYRHEGDVFTVDPEQV